jgi:hypothetical protein
MSSLIIKVITGKIRTSSQAIYHVDAYYLS